MKTYIRMAAVSALAAISLTACAGSGFVPASQAPRVYTAAHDTVDGECQPVHLQREMNNTVEHVRVVRCVSDSGGVTPK